MRGSSVDLRRGLSLSKPGLRQAQDRPFNLQPNRNRANFLNTLKTTWIDGFLYQSLHSEVIKLTMTEANGGLLARDARRRGWQMVKQQAGQADEPIAADKPVGDLFDECGRGLLILGDPGSGKTITLLQLAEDLLAEAAFPGQPMPVVLNLSSWAQEKLALAEWLVAEIFVQYGVGRALARRWIESGSLIYLLDGLDEVAPESRDECVTAINEFRAAQPGVVEMVVCSRTADYETLQQRLNLSAAIRIQPLSDEQVDAYLQRSGLEMQAVRAMLHSDPPLRELTRSPLLLNVMTLAYQGKTTADLQTLNTIEARRHHLFEAYSDAMFAHRPLPPGCPYSEAEARHWLMEVAHGLTEHNVSELYIEKLQPDWLPVPHRHYAFLFGLSKDRKQIEVVEELKGYLSPHKLLKEIKNGLNDGLFGGLRVGPSNNWVGRMIAGLSVGLIFGLFLGLFDGLRGCLTVQETQKKSTPNQGILNSRRNALRMSYIFGLVGGLIGLIGGLIVGLIFELLPGLTFGLFLGLIGGSIVGALKYGGDTVIKHYVLRWLLARHNILPYPIRDKKLIAYLDAMVERILLRRVGNGYMFIHRSLMEHFAAKHHPPVR